MTEQGLALDALRHIPAPADYLGFWKLAKAAKAAGIDYGQFDLWAKDGKGYDEKQNRHIWDAIRLDGKISTGTLFYMAKQHGFEMPKADRPAEPKGVDISGIMAQAQRMKAQPEPGGQASAGEQIGAELKAQRHIKTAAQSRAAAMPYLGTRGITEATAQRFNIGFNPAASFKGKDGLRKAAAVVIPYPESSYYVERNAEIAANGEGSRYNYASGIKRPLFNAPALRGGAAIVFAVEGQLDAISIEQAGGAAIAYGGSGGDTAIKEELEKGGGVTARAFYVVPDDDESGITQAVKVIDALAAAGFKAVLWGLPDGFHDVNDLLTKGGADALAHWLAAANADLEREAAQILAEYKAITPAGSTDSFINTITCGEPVISTGFPTLDNALNGGLTNCFAILGALSSMGKTTLCLQMADQMAAAGRNVLYIALEQGKMELMAKSISRTLFQRYVKLDSGAVMPLADYTKGSGHYEPLELSALEIRTRYRYIPAESKDAIGQALEEYAQGAGQNVYYCEARGADVNASHIRRAVAEHKEKTGNAPIVIIDYLQLLASDTVRDGRTGLLIPKARDEREILNNSIKSLTAISRDFNTIVIGISAFNRNSYKEQAAMDSFNGSSRIEYSADVLMALEPDRTAVKDDGYSWDELKGGGRLFNAKKFTQHYGADVNGKGGVMPMALTLLKNRNGRKDIAVSLDYKPKCDTFTDKAAEVDLTELLARGGAAIE